MSIVFTSFKHPKLPISIKITVTLLQIVYILNKSENATSELFALYIQNYANQECKWKCSLMFKYWVMHNGKCFTDVVTRKHMKAI